MKRNYEKLSRLQRKIKAEILANPRVFTPADFHAKHGGNNIDDLNTDIVLVRLKEIGLKETKDFKLYFKGGD